MIRVILQMLYLLFAVEHLPALDAEHLSVRFRFDGIEALDEGMPFRRVTLDHDLN